MIAVDVLLLVGFTLRLTRLIVSDGITQPVRDFFQTNEFMDDLLNCPYCIGFLIGAATTVSLVIAGGPAEASEIWRIVAGIFALNYVVGHVSTRID